MPLLALILRNLAIIRRLQILSMLFSYQENKTPLHENVRIIGTSRIVLWCIAQVFIFIGLHYLNLSFNLLYAELVLGLFFFSGIFSLSRLKAQKPISNNYVRIQLISDVLLMSLLFHVTGASANPFVSLLLFPLTISAATLSARFTILMALLTLASYGSLYFFDLSETGLMKSEGHEHHSHHLHHAQSNEHSTFSLHLIGMWFNFALSACLISFFIIKMRQVIKNQQDKINSQREKLLQDEQLLGFATQAASAAHHMSTPLSTMAVLVDDLKSDRENESLRADLETLSLQIDNCTHVLNDLRHQANLGYQQEYINEFIAQLIDEFKLIRPGIRLEQTISLSETCPLSISSDPSLRMAILNILNNAADASPNQVRFEASVQHSKLNIVITDFGEHDENNVSRIIGAAEQPFDSDKEHGMGIGLFLSHATINRHQGTISVESSKEAGTRVHINLELSE